VERARNAWRWSRGVRTARKRWGRTCVWGRKAGDARRRAARRRRSADGAGG